MCYDQMAAAGYDFLYQHPNNPLNSNMQGAMVAAGYYDLYFNPYNQLASHMPGTLAYDYDRRTAPGSYGYLTDPLSCLNFPREISIPSPQSYVYSGAPYLSNFKIPDFNFDGLELLKSR